MVNIANVDTQELEDILMSSFQFLEIFVIFNIQK